VLASARIQERRELTDGLLLRDWIPVGFGVGVVDVVAFERVHDGGEGGGDYYALDGWGGFLDGF
jgi:hypothetical protein